MAFRDRFLAFNRGFARVLLAVLSPIVLTLLWVGIGVSCILPRLLGSELLIPFRRGGASHWLEHGPVDMSDRGMRRQG